MAAPVLASLPDLQFDFGPSSMLGTRASAVVNQFCTPLPFSNPKLVEMFRDRNRQPYQDLLPWSGEFAGKFMVHATELYRVTRDPALRATIELVSSQLCKYQDPSTGYLGPFPAMFQTTTWDVWGHAWIQMGMLAWYGCVGDAGCLSCAVKIADLLVASFGGDPKRLYNVGSYEQNCAILYPMVALFSITKTQAYLDLCNTILQEWQIPPCGDYLRNALKGQQFFQGPQPRWEGLHSVMALPQLYYATGVADYKAAYEQIFWSLVQYERHNNGGIMSGEQASG